MKTNGYKQEHEQTTSIAGQAYAKVHHLETKIGLQIIIETIIYLVTCSYK